MTTVPIRTIQTEQRRLATSDSSYNRLVSKPARRFTWLTITAYLAGTNAGLLLVADLVEWAGIASAPLTATYRLFIGGALLAICVACLEARRYGRALFEDYIATADSVQSSATEERAVLSDQARGIPLNETDQIIIRRPAKTLNGVMFQGAWLEKMYSALQDGNQRLTRESSGISGSAYGDCVRVLRQGGYLDENNDYTEAGKAWLATK